MVLQAFDHFKKERKLEKRKMKTELFGEKKKIA